LTGKSHYDVFPDIPAKWKQAHQRCLQGAVEKSEEDQYVQPDGSTRWKQWEIRPWYKASGEVGGIIIFTEDITERKKAAQKIIQSEENLKAIFDNSSEGFILLDDECIIKAFNIRASQVFLINSVEEMKAGRSVFDFVESSRILFFKEVISVALRGEAIQYDRSYTSDSGRLTWINFMINPVWKDGVINGACITAKDITERKEAEEQVKKSLIEKNALAARVSAILNTLPANIALLNENGLIVDVNDSWKNFADDNGFIGNHHGVGDNYIDVSKKFTGEGTTVAEGIQAVLNHQQREFVFEYPCHSPNTKRWFRMVVTPLLEKEYAGAVVMHIDITELRQLELERLNNRVEEQKKITRAILATQEKERHAIGIELHDNVNQILVGTMMALSMVKNNNEKDQHLIETCLSHLRSAIHENRKIAHVFVAPDLETELLVSQLERLFENMLRASGIEVLFDTSEFSEKFLDNDKKTNIYRIAQEQCTNIVKYAKATTVTIIVHSSDELFQMTISDNGKGMKAGKKVTGIGLKNINDRLSLFNGEANIVTAEGKGFTLEISIPL
jgi:PAS domain S-box-containing protein